MHCVASSVHELPREFGFTHHPKGALMSWLEMVASSLFYVGSLRGSLPFMR